MCGEHNWIRINSKLKLILLRPHYTTETETETETRRHVLQTKQEARIFPICYVYHNAI
jgi:hypothetical protein